MRCDRSRPRIIAEAQERHAWLVLVEGSWVVGYAYAGPWRTRPAYRFTCEVSVYLDRARRGAGGGRLLYEHVLGRLATLGYRTVVAGMTEPNPASTRAPSRVPKFDGRAQVRVG